MPQRAQLAKRLPELVGHTRLRLTDPKAGWPALGHIRVDNNWVPVALFVAPVTLSHRDRDHLERRLQNPGQGRPIVLPRRRLPLLLGLWERDSKVQVTRPVLVAADAVRRAGHDTRYSVFASLEGLQAAVRTGWAQGVNASGEEITYFHPALLPLYAGMNRAKIALPTETIAPVLDAAGLSSETEDPAERAHRATRSLVRSAVFGQKVVSAYRSCCALCGLSFGIVEGAHIYPAAAPGSKDEVWNGLALCSNHHAVFDRHLLWIDPASRRVQLHADLVKGRRANAGCTAFIDSTASVLAEPRDPRARPKGAMFRKRYDYYVDRYDWASEH